MTVRECPWCGREVEGGRETCPRCLTTLVADADATITCTQCGRVCPARMQSCPGCLALLRPDPEEVEDVQVELLAEGRRLHRPANRVPFLTGPSCTVTRLVANGGLVICGPEGLVEAHVTGRSTRALTPLRCTAGEKLLFRLQDYKAADRALVAVGDDGAALGTYMHAGTLMERVIDVRDETSAPVARFEPASLAEGAGYRVVETGGGVVATGACQDAEIDGWIDDEWSLFTTGPRIPMEPLAFVALVLAAKVLFGRVAPVRARRPEQEDADDLLDGLEPKSQSLLGLGLDFFFSD